VSDPLSRSAFEDALPWYVNGTLAAPAARRVKEYIDAHPESAIELEWHATLASSVRESALHIPADLDWDEYAGKMGLAKQPASDRSLRSIVAAWWARELRISPALAACACLLVAIQSGALFELSGPATRVDYASERAAAPEVPLLRVRFHRDATEYDIRKLLLGVDARVVDGPNQLGDYSLSVSEERIGAVQQALKDSPLVEMVTVPPRLGCCTSQ
jgi:hypothetical protein